MTFYLAYSRGCEAVSLMTDFHIDHSSWSCPLPTHSLMQALLRAKKEARVVIVEDCANIEALALAFPSIEAIQQQSIPLERFCAN